MKKNLTKVMAMGMVFAMITGTTAFAAEQPENLLISANPIAETEAAAYLNQTGKVTAVEKNENGIIVTIENENDGLRFAVAPATMIVDRKEGALMTADQITEGMEVAVVYEANAPMGMSLPPYLGQVKAVIANVSDTDAGLFAVGHFDKELTDMKLSLKLNIADDTTILSSTGSKQIMKAEDVQDKDAIVFYDFTTRSIPAQTTPSFVMVLEADEEVEEAAAPVALRDAAEEKGYKVVWQGADKAIKVVKEGSELEITLGSTKYVVNGKEADAAVKAELVDGVTYVSSDIFA